MPALQLPAELSTPEETKTGHLDVVDPGQLGVHHLLVLEAVPSREIRHLDPIKPMSGSMKLKIEVVRASKKAQKGLSVQKLVCTDSGRWGGNKIKL